MRDRTKELGNPAEDSDNDEGGTSMIKPGTGKEDKKNEGFLKKGQEIQEGLETLKKKVSELENKQKTVLGVALPDDNMKKELQVLLDEIKGLASQIHKNLKSIKPKKTDEDGKYISINIRIQKTQHAVLFCDFVEVMGKYNTAQALYRDRNVEKMRRQLKITGNSMTDEQLESLHDSGQTDVFTKNSQHDEVLKLKRSIRDLHDIVQDIEMEVEAQGEMVNRIDNNIIHSTNYVEKAGAETGEAVVSNRKSWKPAEDSDNDEGGTSMIKPGTGKEDKEIFFNEGQEIRERLETLKKKVSELENKQKTVLGVALPDDS